jgi:hypothetical protein
MAVFFHDLLARPAQQLRRVRETLQGDILGTTGALDLMHVIGVTEGLAVAKAFALGSDGLLAQAKALPGAAEPDSEEYQAAEAMLRSIPGAPRDAEGNRTMAGLLQHFVSIETAATGFRVAFTETIDALPASAFVTSRQRSSAGTTAMVVTLVPVVPAEAANAFRADERVAALATALAAAGF